ncbi:uncharacterized protein LOC110045414 isoform X2 [Orbicella faveolata]|uniref:uncharacterized protein LOC110045414 isoform X2 n=1 Tax=Orbicella faveolata TaxID=48498 RepID=UPI0009E5765B|nr:uncharacterized protein LOC110045414 isoform X2 [Orbicella faveolata]
MLQQPRSRVENDYFIGQSSGIYDELRFYENPSVELDFSSLDVAAFTKNSSVYRNQSPKTQAKEARKSRPEPMSYMEETDPCGKLYHSTSRRMKRLVALNSILSVLTLICLGFTSFLCYKLLIENDGGTCEGCHNDTPVSGFPTVMPRVAWKNLSENVQTLKDNVSSLEEISVILSTKGKSLQESIKKISEDLTKLSDEINRTQQHLLKNKQAITTLNSTSLKKDVFLELWRKLNSTENDLRDVKDQVINMSKTVPPRGPPGYNGTQGPVGSPGPSGPRGSPGPGANLSLCHYKIEENATKVDPAYAKISVTEQKGKQIMAVHCDTNDAKVSQLSRSKDSDQRQKYTCECKGTVSTGAGQMYCYLHYWECPLST